MAIYSVGRRRVILALLLTAILLLVVDLQGNPVIDRARDIAARVMSPVETAVDVVTTPVTRAWRTYSDYDDIARENDSLREEIDRLRGTQAAYEAAVRDNQELSALFELPSLGGIETAVAQVVGVSSTNLDQIVEINKGSNSGIEVGMPVVNQAGLIGKVTEVTPTTSRVMLVTDQRYSVPVEILVGSTIEEDPVTTSPSGLTEDEIQDLTTYPTTTLVTDVIDTGSTLPGGVPPTSLPGAPTDSIPTDSIPVDSIPADSIPTESIPTTTDPLADPAAPGTSTTTTTIPFVAAEKEFGTLGGRGRGRLPQIRFLQDNPGLSVLMIGDLIVTAGGSESLAPAGIPVGRVVNRVDRPGVSGPLLEVELIADVERLNFIQVVLFKPLSEIGQ